MKIWIIVFLVVLSYSEMFKFGSKVYNLQKIDKGCYEDLYKREVCVNNTFFVKINQHKQDINKILEKYDVTIVKQYSNGLFLLKSDSKNFMKFVEKINLSGDVLYAYPNFYRKRGLR